jgi:uncharacterized membrane protein YkvI
MDGNFAVAALVVAFLVAVVGMIFIALNNNLKTQRMKEWQTFLSTEMTGRIREAVMDLMVNGMDLIPEKLLEAKKELDREEESWNR